MGGRALDVVAPQVGLVLVELLALRLARKCIVNERQPPAHDGQVELAREGHELRQVERVTLDVREHPNGRKAPRAVGSEVSGADTPQRTHEGVRNGLSIGCAPHLALVRDELLVAPRAHETHKLCAARRTEQREPALLCRRGARATWVLALSESHLDHRLVPRRRACGGGF